MKKNYHFKKSVERQIQISNYVKMLKELSRKENETKKKENGKKI